MDEFTLYALEAGPDQLHLTARIDGEIRSAIATAENVLEAAFIRGTPPPGSARLRKSLNP